jgi:nucleotide-binding universal stress UspA family protein
MAGANIPVLIASDDLDVERLAGLVDPNYAEKKLFSVTEELAFLCSGQVEFVSVCPDNGIVIEQSLPEKPQVLRLTEEKKKEIKDRMDLTLKRNADPHTSAHFRTEIAPHGSVDELVKILTEDDIQLAVMTKHHKGKLEKFFLGSVTKGIFDHWKGNLLVLPS